MEVSGFLDIEWLLSTLFDASLFFDSQELLRWLFFYVHAAVNPNQTLPARKIARGAILAPLAHEKRPIDGQTAAMSHCGAPLCQSGERDERRPDVSCRA